MSDRADAHIHLFDGGFRESFTGRAGVKIDEALLYSSLAKDHDIKQALVVGYEGVDWAQGNNAYIATMAREHTWVRPVAFVHLDAPPSVQQLDELYRQGFVGISLYVYGKENTEAVRQFPDEIWSWLVQHRWMVSLNTQGNDLSAWMPILERHRELRVLLSHLAIPPKVSTAPTKSEAAAGMEQVMNLARFPGIHVKLSGFYAVTDPGHDYPHRAAWPYVEVLKETFTTKRLLWGSDCTPCLDNLSFPQTLGLFGHMPFLNEEDRQCIEGQNLLHLLKEVLTAAPAA